jgi:hypothetical protein
MARPSKLTPEVQANVCKTLAAGVDVETACRREGIGARTYYDWLEKGRAGTEPYASFVAATDQAMAEVETAVTYQILKATKQSWQAGAWWVKFRRTNGSQRIELTGKDGAALTTGTLTPEGAELIRQKILYGDREPKAIPAQVVESRSDDDHHGEFGAEDPEPAVP